MTSLIRIVHRLVVAILIASLTFSAPAGSKTRRKPHPASASDAGVAPVADGGRADAVRGFIEEMVSRHGFVQGELEFLFARARHHPAIIELVTPPSHPRALSWEAYRARFVEPERIRRGIDLAERHATDLKRAEITYGVPAEIIVAIMGVETVYGRNTGNWRVIDALATLAFGYPKRAEFFRAELENYLLFARDHDIDVFSVRGSYAGAIGIPQFMPSSWRKWAVDFDGDGRIDLRGSVADSIGSVANFLRGHGWVAGAPVALPARVEGEAWREFAARDILPSVATADLGRYGVVSDPLGRTALPDGARAALIELPTPDRPSEYWIGLDNFYVITRYNRSSFYAMSVLGLAQAIRARRAGP